MSAAGGRPLRTAAACLALASGCRPAPPSLPSRAPDVAVEVTRPLTGDDYVGSPLPYRDGLLAVRRAFSDSEVLALDVAGGGSVRSLGKLPLRPDSLEEPALAAGLVLSASTCPGALSGCSDLSAFDPAKGAVRWTRRMGGSVGGAAAADAAGRTVFIGCDDAFLYALDAADGKVRWKFKAGDAINSTPLPEGDVVYFSGGDKALYALDAATGRQRWRASMPVRTTRPVLLDGILYAADFLGDFHALEAATGKTLWRIRLSGSNPGINCSECLLAGGGVVYAARNEVYAVDVRAGRELWRAPLREGLAGGRLVLSAGKLFVVSSRTAIGYLNALDAATGALLWAFGVRGNVGNSPAEGPDGRIYFIGENPDPYRYNLYGFLP